MKFPKAAASMSRDDKAPQGDCLGAPSDINADYNRIKGSVEPPCGMKNYEFQATIRKVSDKDGAYVVVPFDLPRTFGAGRMKAHARFDGEPYDGSIVATHLDDAQSKSYILGIRKDIRARIGKQPGERLRLPSRARRLTGQHPCS
ncbi:MAG: DUF1905 domain-containing protein [Coriobacteriales bacterium]|jgi:hypothetical protein